MPPKAHLNGSKTDPKKAFFDPKDVIFLIFQFLTSVGGTLGSQDKGGFSVSP